MLLIGAVSLLGVMPVLAQKIYSTPKEYEKLTGKRIEKFNEAPMLRTKVAAGEIPPVEQRLPEEPLVIEPLEEIGQYGGIIRQCHLGAGDATGWWRIGHEPLIYWNKDHTKFYPNIAKSWKISEEGKVFTFYLRKGMKWSDGEPFTADDIMFWYKDILLNKDLTPVVSGFFKRGGEVMKVKKIDDYTVQFCFATPFGYFLPYMAGGREPYAPKHYLKKFHINYVSNEKLEKMTKDAGFEKWSELFLYKNRWPQSTPERPVLRAWKDITDLSEPYHIAERNPYYWKVDTAGNQLPYIDKWRRQTISSADIIVMKIMAGEIDFQYRHMWTRFEEYTLLMENRKKGNYRVLKLSGASPAAINYHLNQNCKDPVLRGLFRTKKFQVALSIGINREEINESLFMGLGEPSQGHSVPGRPEYVESVALANTEYDPERANKLLDEIGLTKRNKEGLRLRPDGKPLTIIVDVVAARPEWVKCTEIIAEQWKKLGIKLLIKSSDPTLFSSRKNQNECQIVCEGISDAIVPWSDQYHTILNRQAPLWRQWLLTKGKAGEEPPADAKRVWYIMSEEGLATTDENKRTELLKEVMKIWSDNPWNIGILRLPFTLAVAKDNLRNVPEKGVSVFPGAPGIWAPYEWFWKK